MQALSVILYKNMSKIIGLVIFYKTNPNHTSNKIKLTPPVDSHITILVELILKHYQNYLRLVLMDISSFLVVWQA